MCNDVIVESLCLKPVVQSVNRCIKVIDKVLMIPIIIFLLTTLQADPDDVDDNCVREIAYDWYDTPMHSPNYEEDNFELRGHLIRCHLAFYVIGIVALAVAIIITAIGCWCFWEMVRIGNLNLPL